MKLFGLGLALAAAFVLLGCVSGVTTQSAGVPVVSATAVLNPQQAAERFRQGESFEHKHNLRAAFEAYTDAGEAGHPMAQKKLGDFYSEGSVAVTRDYETALKWYHKAREQGVEIPVPSHYPGFPIDRWAR